MFASFDALIFDCDGVLVNSEELAQRVEVASLVNLGLVENRTEFVSRYEGKTTTAFRDAVRKDHRRIHGRDIEEQFFEDLFAAVLNAYEKGLSAIEGASLVVQSWSKAKAVASGSTRELVEMKLARTGLASHFEGNIFTSKGLRPKPDPDVFLIAAESIDVEPSRCIVIEDSAIGIEAAKSAGMVAIGFAGGGHCLPGHDQHLRERGADWVFGSHAGIAEFLFRSQ